LPDVAVVPSEHFNTVLYTGNATADHAVTVGYQPDFVWLKNRTDGHSHRLIDAVRGDNKVFYSNTTDAEEVITSGSDDFNFTSTGFTLPASDASINANNKNYVSWNWKANGSGSSNTDGDITSTVSVNTDAGFSIVAYTGNDVNGETIGHGLSKAPELVIIKAREGSYTSVGWGVIGSVLSSTTALKLNDTAATVSAAGVTTNTLPTATVFTVADNYNHSGSGHIAYCFHSVDGYSKVGSMVSNNSTDGTFVYLGFQPKFVLCKGASFASDWTITDNERELGNPFGQEILFANDSLAETTYSAGGIDFVSNGFKVRSRGDGVHGANSSGATFIFIAFAETPFKYSNAR